MRLTRLKIWSPTDVILLNPKFKLVKLGNLINKRGTSFRIFLSRLSLLIPLFICISSGNDYRLYLFNYTIFTSNLKMVGKILLTLVESFCRYTNVSRFSKLFISDGISIILLFEISKNTNYFKYCISEFNYSSKLVVMYRLFNVRILQIWAES